jgi:cytochrome c
MQGQFENPGPVLGGDGNLLDPSRAWTKKREDMKAYMMIVLAVVLLVTVQAGAEEGEAIFKAKGCITCHKKTAGGSKINPSLPEIAQAYRDKEDQLLNYLKGDSEPIVKPQKFHTMKRQLKKISSLSDADLKALADFIMSHSQ